MFRHQMRGLGMRGQAAQVRSQSRHGHRRLALEGLEDRILLSGLPTMYTVDLTSDTGTSTSTGAGDLLYCITKANANTNTAGSEIEFDPTVFSAATPQTITLSSTLELTEKAPAPEGRKDMHCAGIDAMKLGPARLLRSSTNPIKNATCGNSQGAHQWRRRELRPKLEFHKLQY